MPATTTAAETNTALIAATMVHREKKYLDAISKRLALFYWLKSKGRYVPKTGRRLEWPIWYKLKGGELSYQGLDIWSLQESDDATLAYASWKHYHDSMVIAGVDRDVFNTGPEQVFSLADQKEKSMLANLRHKLNSGFYADGSGNNSKDVTGFAATVPQDPTTGTIYGFNRATAGNEFMRSRLVNQGAAGPVAVEAYSGTPVTYTMINGMAKLYMQCGRLEFGEQRYPDLGLCSEDYMLAYESCLVPNQRFQNTAAADAGFTNLKYKKMTLIEDEDCPRDTVNGPIAATTRYGQTGIFLNSEFIQLAYAAKRNFKVIPLAMAGHTQDAFVAHVFWSGEVLVSLPPKHGRHIGIASPLAA